MFVVVRNDIAPRVQKSRQIESTFHPQNSHAHFAKPGSENFADSAALMLHRILPIGTVVACIFAAQPGSFSGGFGANKTSTMHVELGIAHRFCGAKPREEAAIMSAVNSMPLAPRRAATRNRTAIVKPRGHAYEVRPRAAEVAPIDVANRRVAPPAPAVGTAVSRFRVVVRPMLGPAVGLDVTTAITRAVAEELWRLHGGNDVMNWLEAERLLAEALNAAAPRGSA
jgi:hypothetical protein